MEQLKDATVVSLIIDADHTAVATNAIVTIYTTIIDLIVPISQVDQNIIAPIINHLPLYTYIIKPESCYLLGDPSSLILLLLLLLLLLFYCNLTQNLFPGVQVRYNQYIDSASIMTQNDM